MKIHAWKWKFENLSELSLDLSFFSWFFILSCFHVLQIQTIVYISNEILLYSIILLAPPSGQLTLGPRVWVYNSISFQA